MERMDYSKHLKKSSFLPAKYMGDHKQEQKKHCDPQVAKWIKMISSFLDGMLMMHSQKSKRLPTVLVMHALRVI